MERATDCSRTACAAARENTKRSSATRSWQSSSKGRATEDQKGKRQGKNHVLNYALRCTVWRRGSCFVTLKFVCCARNVHTVVSVLPQFKIQTRIMFFKTSCQLFEQQIWASLVRATCYILYLKAQAHVTVEKSRQLQEWAQLNEEKRLIAIRK